MLYTGRMLSILRVALLCLLALAIPAQGFAAAARLLCGPAHHDAASRHLDPAMPVHAHKHEHRHAEEHPAAGHMSSHDRHAWLTERSAPSSAAGVAAPVVIDPPDGRCIACAACCTAAALPAHMPMPTAPPLMSATPLIPGSASRPAFITGGPDRPPRPILA
ncbi:MAG: hypothetical protein EOP40_00420 [Rubrivivax sp.]|nr:MAG: hypothetical protein EOP40_00420 [Rubrivivax sp.]